jgi:hypothetical protein
MEVSVVHESTMLPFVISGFVCLAIIFGLTLSKRERAVGISPSPSPTIQPSCKLRNPRLLKLLPTVEQTVLANGGSLTLNQATQLLQRRYPGQAWSRRDIKIILNTLVCNHHTVVRRASIRSNSKRRGPYIYRPAHAAA